MKYAVSTWLWTSPFTTDTASLFPKIKAMGYDAVEIPVESPALINAGEIARALRENELDAIVCGAFGPGRDLTSEDSTVQHACHAYIDECFHLCNAWGADFFSGPMYSMVGKARMVSADQRMREWDLAVSNLHKVCVRAATAGLKIAIEPLNRFESDLVNTAEDAKRMITDISHPAAKILLDGFHMAIEERDLKQAIVTAGNDLIHVQVSENYRGTPGTGQTPWNSFRDGLETIGYDGAVSIESFTPDNKQLAAAVCIWRNLSASQDEFASQGLRFLKNLLSK